MILKARKLDCFGDPGKKLSVFSKIRCETGMASLEPYFVGQSSHSPVQIKGKTKRFQLLMECQKNLQPLIPTVILIGQTAFEKQSALYRSQYLAPM